MIDDLNGLKGQPHALRLHGDDIGRADEHGLSYSLVPNLTDSAQDLLFTCFREDNPLWIGPGPGPQLLHNVRRHHSPPASVATAMA
jgi:hypothetical protein